MARQKYAGLTMRGNLAIGIILGVVVGFALGFSAGFYKLYRSIDLSQIEKNFPAVKTGMSSGEALKTIFKDVVVFPESREPGIEKWSIWGYDSKKMLKARLKGSRPFTLTVDTNTDQVTEAQFEYNTRFD